MMEKIFFKNFSLFFMVFALSICASFTFASPEARWGLFVEIGQLKAVNENTETEYQESKVLGDQIDYQFALRESFSFLLFATEHMNEGSLPDNKKYEYYKAGIVGAELRFCLGPLFVGVHGGQYFLTWIEFLSSFTPESIGLAALDLDWGSKANLDGLLACTVKIVKRLILKIFQISE